MLKRDIVKVMGSILLGGVVMLGALPACGGSADEVKPIAAMPETTAPATETPVASPEANHDSDNFLELGREIFDETAGGVGCASCHGLDGQGGGAGPNILGIGEFQVREAIRGGVPAMSFIKLNEEEVLAVASYLAEISQ